MDSSYHVIASGAKQYGLFVILRSAIAHRRCAARRRPGIHGAAERDEKWILRCAIAHHSSLVSLAPRNDGVSIYPPLTGGIVTWSRRQARRSISSQPRKCKSLPMQMRTSLKRVRLQVTAMALAGSPGLALMKAFSTSSGETVLGSARSMNSGGIFTAARALRMVSK